MKLIQILLGAVLAQGILALVARYESNDAATQLSSRNSHNPKGRVFSRKLRTMPLGASITYGTKSSDGNGYRKHLRDQLSSSGYTVDMVGSRRAGSMEDNDVEGWPGYTIAQVHTKAKLVYHLKPNLVLINAGTNDCVYNGDVPGAPSRMEDMLEDIFRSIDGVTIVLTGLLPNSKADACCKGLSMTYRTVVKKLQRRRRKIVYAETYNKFTMADLADGTHPNDAGYKKLANIWFQAVQEAERRRFLSPRNMGGK
ncbi:hypothetical protein AJ80_00148 [Polytolypa hystricis UAMH7299]|uniref:SGNH hydrolase-type esterase domain-containing protein n=1 Tax=Polytolypa hystricis (strain UAMH7299) TaxID=1447883 RepID=A0A2B7Z5Y3_POLH7|nr:hypothetical protein AJ80_00148 [Polytolypa hystricis UAMH7299]